MSHAPFDKSRGVIPNENGRVNDSGKKHRQLVASGVPLDSKKHFVYYSNSMN